MADDALLSAERLGLARVVAFAVLHGAAFQPPLRLLSMHAAARRRGGQAHNNPALRGARPAACAAALHALTLRAGRRDAFEGLCDTFLTSAMHATASNGMRGRTPS